MRTIQRSLLTILLLVGATLAWGQETVEQPIDQTAEQTANEQDVVEASSEAEATDTAGDEKETNGNGVDSPKTMSGMSILGNEEAPKSLVIIPWKSSRLGDEMSLSDTLDDRAQPVDKDVFLRELRFHEIRSGEET